MEEEVYEFRRIMRDWLAAMEIIGGCGDSGCVVHKLRGQHTNGGCRCSEDRTKARRVMATSAHFRVRLARLAHNIAPAD